MFLDDIVGPMGIEEAKKLSGADKFRKTISDIETKHKPGEEHYNRLKSDPAYREQEFQKWQKEVHGDKQVEEGDLMRAAWEKSKQSMPVGHKPGWALDPKTKQELLRRQTVQQRRGVDEAELWTSDKNNWGGEDPWSTGHNEWESGTDNAWSDGNQWASEGVGPESNPADSASAIPGTPGLDTGIIEDRLHVGDPVIVTAPNAYEGKTGDIVEFSPSGRFVIVRLYNHGEHSMHLSDVEYNEYADQEDEVDEGWSDAVVSQRTGQPRTPYSVYIKGRKWRDFENDDHAEAVANKLRAKFKAEGRDPSVITIAPTDYDKDIKEAGNPAQQAAIAIAKKKEQGVAEGLSQNQGQVRQTLNAWMNKDQKFKDPTQRAGFQAKVWPYIQTNINSILSDKGKDGKGGYPAAPYAAWLLVQHMDAYPQNQVKFLQQLEQSGLNPDGKLQFLKDRAAVNQWIMKNANNPEYFIKGKALPNPTVNVRNPAMFRDAGIVATSREEALANAEQAGNKLLVAAVNATNAQTQPSYKQSANENFADGKILDEQGMAEGLGDSNTQEAIIDTVERLFRKNNLSDYGALEAIRQGVKHHFSKPGATAESAIEGILNILDKRMRKSGDYLDLSRFKEALRQGVTHQMKKQGVAESTGDLRTELARVYRAMAPGIERHRDSHKAGELYDALEAVAAKHNAHREFTRIIGGAKNRAHMEYDTNPGGFENWFWFLPFATDEQGIDEVKQRLDAKCWAGKHKEGTKIKGGVRVNNCVPNESVQESYWTKLQNERNTRLNSLVNELSESVKKIK